MNAGRRIIKEGCSEGGVSDTTAGRRMRGDSGQRKITTNREPLLDPWVCLVGGRASGSLPGPWPLPQPASHRFLQASHVQGLRI